MAWFRNGRKYWKYRGRIYSCKAKRRSSSSDYSPIVSSGTKKYKYNFKNYSDTERYHKDLKENEDAWMDALDSIYKIDDKKKYNYEDNYENNCEEIISEYERNYEDSMSEPISEPMYDSDYF